MRPGDRRTKTMDRDPNTESKAQRLAELSRLSLPDKPPRSRKQAKTSPEATNYHQSAPLGPRNTVGVGSMLHAFPSCHAVRYRI